MSHEPFLSMSWYRVANLRPKLPEHSRIQRHRYGGATWYVLQDQSSGKFHRLSAAGHMIVATMDGSRTVDALWVEAAKRLGEEALSQDEFIRFLSDLHAADLLHVDVPPDSFALLARSTKLERSRLWQKVLNPLSVRIPIWNPDKFLRRTLPAMAWLFSWLGVTLWVAVVFPACILAVQHWSELSENVSDRILATENLLMIATCYPVIKALHELGHGYAVKSFGGVVPEMGVMLLVLLPMPYVDASASSGFRSKWRRIAVGAAGILVETFLAALALYIWLLVEPGFVRAIAFNVMLIAGVSTVLFNGNPLLRYDGYYVLADLIEIPNLAQRATAYWSYLINRHLLGSDEMKPVGGTVKERLWLAIYAPTSFLYRMMVMLGIAIFIASEYLAVGVAIAVLSLFTSFLLPISKAVWHVVASPRLRRCRTRAVGITLGLLVSAAIAIFLIPAPLHTTTEGVVWIPENAIIRAGTDGFVQRLLTVPGRMVAEGDALVESEEPTLAAHVKSLQARVEELEAQLESERFKNRVDAEITSAELRHARAELAAENMRAQRLTARSRTAGVFAVPTSQDLPGRFVREGQTIGYVLPPGSRTIRATIDQDDIDLVRKRLRRSTVKLAERVEDTLPARLVREVPAGSDELPSKALSSSGGGLFAVDPRDPHGTKTLRRVFQVDLELPDSVAPSGAFGSRAYVRFDHEWEPVGNQMWRRVRQTLLSRLNF
jgi:putative peptide zinc metalloprotease protein